MFASMIEEKEAVFCSGRYSQMSFMTTFRLNKIGMDEIHVFMTGRMEVEKLTYCAFMYV